jgi:biotin synthase
MFDRLLDEASAGITPDLALRILDESRPTQNALKLFSVASELRDKHLGRRLWWTGAIEGILPCKLQPLCRYCNYSIKTALPNDSLLKALSSLEQLGIKHLHLSGGTNPDGYDAEILSMVEAMRGVSDVAIEVNLGPSLTRDTVRRLKQLGVSSITSSIETVNEDIFRTTKPGDSLDQRKALLEMCDEEGMATRGMMLVGLGESNADRIRLLFYLKGLKHLHQARFSRYMPREDGRLKLPRCSPWEVARLIAVARLILPGKELGLASGNSHDDIPLWFLAGGGNQLIGAHASRRKATGPNVIATDDEFTVSSSIPLHRQYASDLGLEIGFECPVGA